MHVRGPPQRPRPVIGNQLQSLLIEALRVAQPTLGDADVGHRNRTPRGCRRYGRCAASRRWSGCTPRRQCPGRPRTRPRARAARGQTLGPARRPPVRWRAPGEHERRCSRCRHAAAPSQLGTSRSHPATPAAARHRRRSSPRRRGHRGASASHCSASCSWASTRSNSPAAMKPPTRPTASTGRARTMSVGKTLRPLPDRRVLAPAPHRGHCQFRQRCGLGEVSGCERVPDRVRRLTIVAVPDTRSAVKLGCGAGILVEKPSPQHIGEEVVIPIPLASIVERYDEQVLSVEGCERRLPSGPAGHGVAERPVQSVEDRRLQEELPDGLGLALQHLAGQIVDDEPIVAGESCDERRGVLASLQRQCRELQSGDPAFVRASNVAMSAAVRSRPIEPFRYSAASSAVKRRSAARISASSPRARKRANGRGGSDRLVTTSCTRSGRFSRR